MHKDGMLGVRPTVKRVIMEAYGRREYLQKEVREAYGGVYPPWEARRHIRAYTHHGKLVRHIRRYTHPGRLRRHIQDIHTQGG